MGARSEKVEEARRKVPENHKKNEDEIECYKKWKVTLEQEIQKYKDKDLENKNVLKRKWMQMEKQVRNEFEKESNGETIVDKDSNNNERAVRIMQSNNSEPTGQGKEDGEIEDKDNKWEWVEVKRREIRPKGIDSGSIPSRQ